MPKLLVIDTSASICKVGLSIEGSLQQRETNTPRQAAQEVLGLINDTLTENGLALADLDAIAIASGPGSFTGLRIGIGIAQGLAEAAALPVIAISNLAVCAYTHLKSTGASRAVVCFTARDNETYIAAYEISQRLGVKLEGNEKAISNAAQQTFLNHLKQPDDWVLVGDGWENDVLNCYSNSSAPALRDIELSLSDLAEIGERHLGANLVLKPEQLTPNYVKEELDYLS